MVAGAQAARQIGTLLPTRLPQLVGLGPDAVVNRPFFPAGIVGDFGSLQPGRLHRFRPGCLRLADRPSTGPTGVSWSRRHDYVLETLRFKLPPYPAPVGHQRAHFSWDLR